MLQASCLQYHRLWLSSYQLTGKFNLIWVSKTIRIKVDVCPRFLVSRSLLRTYAHDDVSVGSWFIGVDVKHVDENKFCCSSWSSGGCLSLEISSVVNTKLNSNSSKWLLTAWFCFQGPYVQVYELILLKIMREFKATLTDILHIKKKKNL